MESISPVWTEAEKHLEREIAKNQPEYSAIIGLPVTLEIIDKDDHSKRSYLQDYSISVRFRLSPEEREAVAAGKDLVVTQLLFGNRFTPINLQFCSEGEKPTVEIVLPKLPPQADGDPSAADLDEFTEAQQKMELARAHTAPQPVYGKICPSCGETDKTAASACANSWHTEGVEKVLPEPAEDQPQSGV